MDILHRIGDFWVRRQANPDPALARIEGLKPATVITGASEGLGFALARRLAKEGRNIVLLARTAEILEDATAQLAHSFPKARIFGEALDGDWSSTTDVEIREGVFPVFTNPSLRAGQHHRSPVGGADLANRHLAGKICRRQFGAASCDNDRRGDSLRFSSRGCESISRCRSIARPY